MAGGSHAPKVALHDVAALIGAVLLLSSLALMFFVSQTTSLGSIEAEEGELPLRSAGSLVTIDLNAGDKVSIVVEATDCFPEYEWCINMDVDLVDDAGQVVQSDSLELGEDKTDKVEFEVEESGTYTLDYSLDGEIEWGLHVERRWMQPYLMPLLGAAILGWGIWQGQQVKQLEQDEN